MKFFYFLSTLLFLNGCMSTSFNKSNSTGTDDNSFQKNRYQSNKNASTQIKDHDIHSMKNINHYVRNMMIGLVDNLQYVNTKTPIAVTSFVDLDGQYNQASLLGNQLAESFIHEVHDFGIPVIDFKATDFIRVTPSGDFAFTRDFLELENNNAIEYVLAGTLVKHHRGYLVNARIVGLNSKAVVASSQGLIPAHIVDELLRTSLNDGIPLSNDR